MYAQIKEKLKEESFRKAIVKKEDTKLQRKPNGEICGTFLNGSQINTEKRIKRAKDFGNIKYFYNLILLIFF